VKPKADSFTHARCLFYVMSELNIQKPQQYFSVDFEQEKSLPHLQVLLV
jgi:hypothetical protein